MTNDLIKRVAEQNLPLVERAGRVDIRDRDTADEAGRLLMQVKAAQSAIKDARMRITRPLRNAIDEAIEQEKQATQPLLEAEQHIKGCVLEWEMQEALRIEEAKAELEQRQADLESASLRAMEEGRMTDAAEAITELAEFVPEEKPYRAAGTQVREVWKAEVTDLEQMLAWVIQTGRYDLVRIDQAALNRLAKTSVNVPGVRFYSEKSVAASGRY